MNSTQVKLKVFDDIIPFWLRLELFQFCSYSTFTLGWADLPKPDEKHTPNLHSTWDQDDLSKSGIIPYIDKCIDQTSWFNSKVLKTVELNMITSNDVHYIHTHPQQNVALYYVNMNWKDGWYGETMFHNEYDIDDVIFTSVYKPGRIILFDGHIPHAIRPQSINGPKFRLSLSLIFENN